MYNNYQIIKHIKKILLKKIYKKLSLTRKKCKQMPFFISKADFMRKDMSKFQLLVKRYNL